MTTLSPELLAPLVTRVTVRSVERLSPAFVRVELGAPELAQLGVDGPLYDQRFKLVFPGDSGTVPAVSGVDWFTRWAALPEAERGNMRTYTIRELRGTGEDTRLVVDMVLHLEPGATGPGSRWAARASVGDPVLVIAPRRGVPFGGIEFDPRDAARLLLVADETAVPAVAGILECLPEFTAGTAYLEVPSSADLLDLRIPPGVRVVWLPRDGAAHGERLCRAVLTLFGLEGGWEPAEVDPDLWETPTHSSSGEPLPEPDADPAALYAWIAGEAGMVTRLRRHLVRDAGLDRRSVAFMGYWREGVAMRG